MASYSSLASAHTPIPGIDSRMDARARAPLQITGLRTADVCVCVCVRGVVFVWPPHALAKDTHWMYLFEHYIVRVSGAVFLRSPLMCDAWLRSLLVGCTNCNVRFAEHIHQHTKKHNTQSISDSIDWRIYIDIEGALDGQEGGGNRCHAYILNLQYIVLIHLPRANAICEQRCVYVL